MPRRREETFGTGDQSWLGSAHGIWNCRTETLDVSKFTAANHYPDGYIPSGTPLTEAGGTVGPYANDGVLVGFLFTDLSVDAEDDTLPVPVLDHGRVKVKRLPTADFTPPVLDANNATTVVFI